MIKSFLKTLKVCFSKITVKKVFIFIAILLILGFDSYFLSLLSPNSDSDISKIEKAVSLHEEEILKAIPNNYEIIREHTGFDIEMDLVYNFDDIYYITITDDSNDNIKISVKNDDVNYPIDYILTEDSSLEKVKETSSDAVLRIISSVFLMFLVDIALGMFFVWLYMEFCYLEY